MGLTKASYSMVSGAVVNVLDYGAVGNGTTDDSAAIQDAIDYLVTQNGGTLWFPAGDFYVASTLTIDLGSGTLRIIGDERYSTFITVANDTTGLDTSVGSLSMEYLTIRSVSYRSGSTADTSGIGITMAGRPIVKAVNVFGFGGAGIKAVTPDKFINAEFDQVRIGTCGKGFHFEGSGVGNDFTTTSNIKNTYVASCTTGLYARSFNSSYAENLIIEACTIGADISGCNYFTAYSWYFEANTTPYTIHNSTSVIVNETLSNNTNPSVVTYNDGSFGQIPFPNTILDSSQIAAGKLGINGIQGASATRSAYTTYIEHQNVTVPRALLHTDRDVDIDSGITPTGVIPQVNGGTVTPTKSHNIFTALVIADTGTVSVVSDDDNITVTRAATGVYDIDFTNTSGVIIDELSVQAIEQYTSATAPTRLQAFATFTTSASNAWTRVKTANTGVASVRVQMWSNSASAVVDGNFFVRVAGRLTDE